MDHLTRKARRTVSANASRASSGSSARSSARRAARKTKRQQGQRAGDVNGSERSSGRRARSEDEEEDVEEGGRQKKRAKGTEGGTERSAACASYTVGALHVVDAGLGIALVVYGGMVRVAQVTAACVLYGLLLSLGAVAGAAGYYSAGCGRWGLLASSAAGCLASLLDIVLFVSSVTMWDSFVKYLDDNREALMLDEGSIESIRGLLPLFAVIFLILAGLEGHRCLAMMGVESRESSGREHKSSPSNKSGSSKSICDRLLSLVGLDKHKKTDDLVTLDSDFSHTMGSALLRPEYREEDSDSSPREEYLSFVPDHEGALLANFADAVPMPTLPEERMDY